MRIAICTVLETDLTVSPALFANATKNRQCGGCDLIGISRMNVAP